jgi:hypothetical protein
MAENPEDVDVVIVAEAEVAPHCLSCLFPPPEDFVLPEDDICRTIFVGVKNQGNTNLDGLFGATKGPTVWKNRSVERKGENRNRLRNMQIVAV